MKTPASHPFINIPVLYLMKLSCSDMKLLSCLNKYTDATSKRKIIPCHQLCLPVDLREEAVVSVCGLMF